MAVSSNAMKTDGWEDLGGLAAKTVPAFVIGAETGRPVGGRDSKEV